MQIAFHSKLSQLKVYDRNIYTTDSLYLIINDLTEILRM